MSNLRWTKAKEEKLRELAAAPEQWSAAEIAARLGDGDSRSGVIGKMHRLKIISASAERMTPRPRRGEPPQIRTLLYAKPTISKIVTEELQSVKSSYKLKQTTTKQQTIAKAPNLPAGASSLKSPISLAEATNNACRWIIGDQPRNPMCCGLEVYRGVYCKEHYTRAHTTIPLAVRVPVPAVNRVS